MLSDVIMNYTLQRQSGLCRVFDYWPAYVRYRHIRLPR